MCSTKPADVPHLIRRIGCAMQKNNLIVFTELAIDFQSIALRFSVITFARTKAVRSICCSYFSCAFWCWWWNFSILIVANSLNLRFFFSHSNQNMRKQFDATKYTDLRYTDPSALQCTAHTYSVTFAGIHSDFTMNPCKCAFKIVQKGNSNGFLCLSAFTPCPTICGAQSAEEKPRTHIDNEANPWFFLISQRSRLLRWWHWRARIGHIWVWSCRFAPTKSQLTSARH